MPVKSYLCWVVQGTDECCPEEAPTCCADEAGEKKGECVAHDGCITPGDCSSLCTPQDECCAQMGEDKPYCCAGFASNECVDFPGCTPGDCSGFCEVCVCSKGTASKQPRTVVCCHLPN